MRIALIVLVMGWGTGAVAAPSQLVVDEVIDVEPVWAGHPVGFQLWTEDDRQLAAYWNAGRAMTVAARDLGSEDWSIATLPEKIGWDSHNYIRFFVDRDGYIHLSGNLHVDPLVYFRTTEPMDITTFERKPMVGEREQRTTYPEFFEGPDGRLIFTYRDGSSGNGDQIYNVYDYETQTWSRLLDEPFTSGGGKMNAYFNGPKEGPDGRYHMCWVWRDHGGAETNHDLSYARSEDLVHWETSAGEPLELPITLDEADVVDPVPPKGGIINGNTKLGFDHQDRVIVSYHKYDGDGNTQLYNARLEEGRWVIYQTSDWDYRWDFGGGGSIPFEVRLSGVGPHDEDGLLRQGYSHSQYGSATWLLDPETLQPVGTLVEPPKYPPALSEVEGDYEGLRALRTHDAGTPPEGVEFVMKWETLGSHRDRPREEAPPPSMLRVYRLVPRGD